MWPSPPIQGESQIPVLPKATFWGYHCLNGGGYGTPPDPTTGLGSGEGGLWAVGWDGILHL